MEPKPSRFAAQLGAFLVGMRAMARFTHVNLVELGDHREMRRDVAVT